MSEKKEKTETRWVPGCHTIDNLNGIESFTYKSEDRVDRHCELCSNWNTCKLEPKKLTIRYTIEEG